MQEAGGRAHLKYWIPAEVLDEFNAAIVGPIEFVSSFLIAKKFHHNPVFS